MYLMYEMYKTIMVFRFFLYRNVFRHEVDAFGKKQWLKWGGPGGPGSPAKKIVSEALPLLR